MPKGLLVSALDPISFLPHHLAGSTNPPMLHVDCVEKVEGVSLPAVRHLQVFPADDVHTVGDCLKMRLPHTGTVATKMVPLAPFSSRPIGIDVGVNVVAVKAEGSISRFGSPSDVAPTGAKAGIICRNRPVLIDSCPEPYIGRRITEDTGGVSGTMTLEAAVMAVAKTSNLRLGGTFKNRTESHLEYLPQGYRRGAPKVRANRLARDDQSLPGDASILPEAA